MRVFRRFRDLSMKVQLIVIFLVVGVIPLAVAAWLSYSGADAALLQSESQSSDSLEKQTFAELVALRDVKTQQIEQYFKEREGDMGVLAETVATLREEAFGELTAIREIKKNQVEAFFAERKANVEVLASDPFVVEAFKELDAAFEEAGGAASGEFRGKTNEEFDAPQDYVEVHDRYIATFKQLMDKYQLDELKSRIDSVPEQYRAMLTDAVENARTQYDRMERSQADIENMTADLGLLVEHTKFHVAACRRELQELDPEGRFSL